MRTFVSVPSRDLIDSMAPSTASMVPRMRTGGGGCCAQAAVPNRTADISDAASTRGSSEEIVGMVFPPKAVSAAHPPQTPEGSSYSLAASLISHWRRQPVAADADAVGLERAVRQLFHEGDHLGAGLEVGFVGGNIGHHGGFGGKPNPLLARLLFDQQSVTVSFRHALV